MAISAEHLPEILAAVLEGKGGGRGAVRDALNLRGVSPPDRDAFCNSGARVRLWPITGGLRIVGGVRMVEVDAQVQDRGKRQARRSA